MKIRTNELTGAALDWAVAKASQPVYSDTALVVAVRGGYDGIGNFHEPFSPSTNWAQGGPIVEREDISTIFVSGDLGEPKSYWVATANQQAWQYGYGPYHEQDDERSLQIYKSEGLFFGPTPLIAAMRAYVASKLGDEVEVPDELIKENQP